MKKISILVLCVVLTFTLSGCFLRRTTEKATFNEQQNSSDTVADTEIPTSSQNATQSNVKPQQTTPATSSQVTQKTNTQSQNYKNVTDPRDLVEIYNNYVFWGFCCDYEDVDIAQVEKYFTEDQKQFVCTVVKSKCCKNRAEAKAHAEHYLDKSFLNEYFLDYNYLEINNSLYVLMGGVGGVMYDHDTMQVKNLPNGNIEIIADCLDSGGGFTNKEVFTVKKENGRYILLSVKSQE